MIINNEILKIIGKSVLIFVLCYSLIFFSTKDISLSLSLSITILIILLLVDNLILINKEKFGNSLETVTQEIHEQPTTQKPNLDDKIVVEAKDFNKEYVDYQHNQEIKDRITVEEGNIFKMAMGNQNIVQPYLKDSKKYYTDLHNRGVNYPDPTELAESELKYGDLNYITPINAGMVNREMSYVAPQNWYPIWPVPPVCVTNKESNTQPLSVVNNYMPFSTMKDFDRARRFTGSMNINIDYIKNILNNPVAG